VRMLKIICIAATLMVGWFTNSVAEELLAGKLAGTYVNKEPDSTNYLLLVNDGRGSIISEKPTGQWTFLMSFHWKVNGDNFYLEKMNWTIDGKVFKEANDDSTTFKWEEGVLQTRDSKRGKWIRWEPTETDVFDEPLGGQLKGFDLQTSDD
jgi:hypothetical protein